MEKPQILYVEDDRNLSFVTSDNLAEQGYEVTACMNGEEGLSAFRKNTFDLLILDVMLPKLDGFSVAQRIRDVNKEVPIIFLTAKSLEDDKIHGLKIGADDYLTKPFSMEELILKIEVFLKRTGFYGKVDSQPSKFIIGNYEFDYPNQQLLRGNNVTQMTFKEAEILKVLADSRNLIVKREALLEKVWGENDYFLGRSLDVFISKLRKHLNGDESVRIENVYGVGFRLVA